MFNNDYFRLRNNTELLPVSLSEDKQIPPPRIPAKRLVSPVTLGLTTGACARYSSGWNSGLEKWRNTHGDRLLRQAHFLHKFCKPLISPKWIEGWINLHILHGGIMSLERPVEPEKRILFVSHSREDDRVE